MTELRVRGYESGTLLWGLFSHAVLRPLRGPVMFVWHRAVLRYEERAEPGAPWRKL